MAPLADELANLLRLGRQTNLRGRSCHWIRQQPREQTPEIITQLHEWQQDTRFREAQIRKMLTWTAQQGHLNPEAIEKLLKDEEATYIRHMLGNPHLGEQELEWLETRASRWLVGQLEHRQQQGANILELYLEEGRKLSKDNRERLLQEGRKEGPLDQVVRFLLLNPSPTTEELRELLGHLHVTVNLSELVNHALSHPNTTQRLARQILEPFKGKYTGLSEGLIQGRWGRDNKKLYQYVLKTARSYQTFRTFLESGVLDDRLTKLCLKEWSRQAPTSMIGNIKNEPGWAQKIPPEAWLPVLQSGQPELRTWAARKLGRTAHHSTGPTSR